MSTPPTFETLPSELILHTLTFLPLDSVAAYSQTSRLAASLVYEDSTSLWKQLYLQSFDDPRTDGWTLRPPLLSEGTHRAKRLALERDEQQFPWRERATSVLSALREWNAGRLDLVRGEANSVTTSYAALITLIHTAPPAGSPSLNLSKLLTSVPSTLPTLHTLPSLAAQDYYRLLTHVLPHGLPQVAAVYSRTLTEAREIVYAAPSAASNLQTAEGGVDWRVVWALNVVQHWNMRRGMEGRVWEEEETSEAPWPWKMEHARPRGLSERVWLSEEKEDWDWAGIGGGEWVGCYSFIDFSDYISFNRPDLTRARGRPSLLNVDEAVGDLMHLRLIPTCSRPSASSSTLPRIHFSGTSNSPVESSVRGSCWLTTDNPPQVRVTYVISYNGAERWRLEGVQVGGIGGRRGVTGLWQEAEPQEHSPSGPFYFWKTKEKEEGAEQ